MQADIWPVHLPCLCPHLSMLLLYSSAPIRLTSLLLSPFVYLLPFSLLPSYPFFTPPLCILLHLYNSFSSSFFTPCTSNHLSFFSPLFYSLSPLLIFLQPDHSFFAPSYLTISRPFPSLLSSSFLLPAPTPPFLQSRVLDLLTNSNQLHSFYLKLRFWDNSKRVSTHSQTDLRTQH